MQYICKNRNLALNNEQWLICHNTKANQTHCLYETVPAIMEYCRLPVKQLGELLKYFAILVWLGLLFNVLIGDHLVPTDINL